MDAVCEGLMAHFDELEARFFSRLGNTTRYLAELNDAHEIRQEQEDFKGRGD